MEKHKCELDAKCKCVICGKYRHSCEDDTNGFFTNGRVNVRCTRCGAEESYYNDTGTIISTTFPEHVQAEEKRKEKFRKEKEFNEWCRLKKEQKANSTDKETLYIAEKMDISGKTQYIVKGVVDREYAEKNRIRHITTIIVPFILDGDKEGKWLVHDRTPKLQAKKKPIRYDKSYNFIGGHLKAIVNAGFIGKPIYPLALLNGALEELNEELIKKECEAPLERYYAQRLIPAGFTEYESNNNVEYSYVFALPVPSEDYENAYDLFSKQKLTNPHRYLISADDYDDNGVIRSVRLELDTFTEDELKEMAKKAESNPDYHETEICDAITRLWLPENKETLDELNRIIAGKYKNFPQSKEEIGFRSAVESEGNQLYSDQMLDKHIDLNDYYSGFFEKYMGIMLKYFLDDDFIM